jgi:hypothetical protein
MGASRVATTAISLSKLTNIVNQEILERSLIEHQNYLAALGRLVPYLERACLRSLTPAVSNVPRMM